MARHHYVPQFLLRQWGQDGRFCSFYWDNQANRVITNDKALIGAACQIKDLNRLLGVPKLLQYSPETDHWTPRIDTPAAVALRILLDSGPTALTEDQRMDWARFLIAFAARTPETLRIMGAKAAEKGFSDAKAVAKGPPELEALVDALLDKHKTMIMHNMPLHVATSLTHDPALVLPVSAMHWWVRTWDKNALLIGNRPLMSAPPSAYPCGISLDHPNCLIALPIAPNKLFLAARNPRSKTVAGDISLSRLAHLVNEETIRQSTTIHAADTRLERFVSERLARKAAKTAT